MKINKAYVRMRTKNYQEQSIKYKKITSFNFCNFLDLKVFRIGDVLYSNRYVNHFPRFSINFTTNCLLNEIKLYPLKNKT